MDLHSQSRGIRADGLRLRVLQRHFLDRYRSLPRTDRREGEHRQCSRTVHGRRAGQPLNRDRCFAGVILNIFGGGSAASASRKNIEGDEAANAGDAVAPVFGKVKDDQRITRVGKWLRRTSIDELPQILNVFRGEMSIVGPRPPIPYEVEDYDIWHRKRLDMRPGITGLWQVSGRNRLTFDEMVRVDLYYIENWTLLLDLKIIFLTLPAVFRGDGAR